MLDKQLSSVTQQFTGQAGMAMAQIINSIPDGSAKVNFALAATFNGVSTIAALIMDGFNQKEGVYPNNDHCLLALFLLHEGCSISSDADARCEFSPARFWEAMEDFKRFTGRDAEPLIDKNLLKMIKDGVKIDASKFGPNSKFLQ